jgi:hypothetical protein
VLLGLVFDADPAGLGAAGGALALPLAISLVSGCMLEVPTRRESLRDPVEEPHR